MIRFYFAVVVSLLFAGCASYTTPGGPAQLSDLASPNINQLMAQRPAANFPARLAVARVQASGYTAYDSTSFGAGRYSVVFTRDVESQAAYERLGAMAEVAAIAPLNRILLPTRLDSIESLREGAARLQSDILLIYTFDTTFQAGEQRFLPLNTIALGFLKNKKVTVTTTASAALFDVRTEFLYGLAEATAVENRQASVWSTQAAVDDLRVATEKAAFTDLVREIEQTWTGVVAEHRASRQ